jgi:hypothetical protein
MSTVTLSNIVSFIDDGPWCGTRPPGIHPPRRGQQLESFVRNLASEVALNPQPLPPGPPETLAYLWQAVRLYQLGQIASNAKVAGNAAEALTGEAQRIFDDGDCGTVPWSVLLQWLRHPPPPPPPWLDVIAQAVTNVLIASKLTGDLSKQLQGAATAVIQGQIGQAATQAKTRAA